MTDFEVDFEDELDAVPDAYYDQTRFVPGAGPLDADVMLIGEAPGAREVRQGEPFVGQAGKQLDRTLQTLDVNRGDLYITNLVKVRPPDNRTPRKGEIEAWQPLLDAEIEHVAPEVIVTMGSTASRTVLETDEGITAIHGKRFDRRGRVVVPVYHPAATLYDRSKLSDLEADLHEALEMA